MGGSAHAGREEGPPAEHGAAAAIKHRVLAQRGVHHVAPGAHVEAAMGAQLHAELRALCGDDGEVVARARDGHVGAVRQLHVVCRRHLVWPPADARERSLVTSSQTYPNQTGAG